MMPSRTMRSAAMTLTPMVCAIASSRGYAAGSAKTRHQRIRHFRVGHSASFTDRAILEHGAPEGTTKAYAGCSRIIATIQRASSTELPAESGEKRRRAVRRRGKLSPTAARPGEGGNETELDRVCPFRKLDSGVSMVPLVSTRNGSSRRNSIKRGAGQAVRCRCSPTCGSDNEQQTTNSGALTRLPTFAHNFDEFIREQILNILWKDETDQLPAPL